MPSETLRPRCLKSEGLSADCIHVRPKLRLDPVVKLEEQREELRLREMADASRRLQSAEELLNQTRARAGADERRPSRACDWQLAELSHARALLDVRAAEHAVRSASDESSASRVRYTAAHSRAEAVRKIVEARVGEIVQAREAAANKELDDLAIMRHGREGSREASEGHPRAPHKSA
ncbi:MAG: hypothetical protein ABUL77_05270 [Bacteroidota bacterium]